MNPAKMHNRRMGLGSFAVGVCLIWMPTVAIFDLLPACIGYLLIYHGLYQLADLDENIADARHLFARMAILATVRLISIPILFGFISASERPVMILSVAFVLGIFDLVTLVPAWKKLSTGMTYLATRHDGVGVFATKGKGTRNLTEKVTSFTVLFFAIKEVMAILPEVTVLTGSAGGADADSAFFFPYLYDYIALMRAFAALIVFGFGLVWLVRMWRHMRRIIADTSFFDRLHTKYADEVLTRPDLFAKRRIKATLICTCIALAFSVDLYLDDVNVIPDFIMGALFIVSMLMLRRYVYPTLIKRSAIVSTVYTAVSAAAWILHLTQPPLGDLSFPMDNEGMNAYILLCSMQVLSRILMVIALFFLLRVWKEIIRRYTGFSVTHQDIDHPDPHVQEVHKTLNKRLWLVLTLGAAAAITSIIYSITLPLAAYTLWEIWTLVDFLAQIALFVSFIAVTNAIVEQIEYKYMLS